MWHVYTYTHKLEYYSAIKEWKFAICNNMDGFMLSEIKSDRERQILYDISYMWTLKKNKTSEFFFF